MLRSLIAVEKLLHWRAVLGKCCHWEPRTFFLSCSQSRSNHVRFVFYLWLYEHSHKAWEVRYNHKYSLTKGLSADFIALQFFTQKSIVIRSRTLERRKKLKKMTVLNQSGTWFAWVLSLGLGKGKRYWEDWGQIQGLRSVTRRDCSLQGGALRAAARLVCQGQEDRVLGWKARHPLSGWGNNLSSHLQASHKIHLPGNLEILVS